MDVQSTNARRVPTPQPLHADRLAALWHKLQERFRIGVERPDREVPRLEFSDSEVGELLAEIVRLKEELYAARQLRHQATEDDVLVAPATLASLLLLSRDVQAFQRAQSEWLARRAPAAEALQAIERVWEDVDLVERALRGASWPQLQQLTLDDLRALARREGVS